MFLIFHFYFHDSIFNVSHKIPVLYNLQVVKNKMNFKTEMRVTELSEFGTSKIKNYSFEINKIR